MPPLETFEITRVFSATLLAIIGMISMIVGTIIGIYLRPSQRTNAIIMAFGTGALIQALAIELAFKGAQRLTSLLHYSGLQAWILVAVGFIVGGVGYYLGNKSLDKKGAAMRHPALAKFYLLKIKREESSDILKKLSNVELLRSIPPEDMESILDFVTPIEVPPNKTIFHRGDPADGLYLITDGQVNIIADSSSNEQVIASLGPGNSFGEMALLTGEMRSASAVTTTQTTLLKIDKEHFDALMVVSPSLKKSVELLNSQRILINVQKLQRKLDKEHWQKIAIANIHRLSKMEELNLMQKHASSGAPFALFLGSLMDTIPESIIIGASFVSFDTYQYTFLAAVFLSNLPEAMASSHAMIESGFSSKRIFTLWGSLIIAGAIAAALGNIFLLGAQPTIITFVEALAGGGILAMVASVMMPEAYEDGGAEVGLATIAGFLAAFFFALL
ncbi:MAG: cyclic nucleotide-binding domain-containing protein [Bacteroidota bacterium]|nr:cyclic nucleotide-binding domain-containing protein [Bacteroidota bacterium]